MPIFGKRPAMRLLLLLLLLPFFPAAQQYPEYKPLFHDSVVSEAHILIHPDSLQILLDDLENEYEYHTTFIYTNPLCPQDTFTDAGFRLRGGTSLVSKKKSFKVSLNTYVPGRKYHGIEKLNFNGEHNDPCIMRTRLCWDVCRDFGIPAPRSSYANLFINSDYYGLYMNVEHIDEEFVDSRYGNKSGNLYKCLWPADLTWLGNDPDLYKFMVGDRRAYELHTNTLADNYADLALFIDILNNTPDPLLPEQLSGIFNVSSYLKYLAFEAITGHWDAYSYNKNNYYLYFDTDKNRFEFIPYDVDNTFGIDWFGIDWGVRDIYNWSNQQEARPLTQRILANPLWREEYSFFVNQFIQEVFSYPLLNEKIDYWYSMIYPHAVLDPYRPLDYGWTMTQFNASFTQQLGSHVTYGLKPYINTRVNSALSQVVLPQVPDIRINEFQASNTLTIADEFGEFDDWIELYNAGNQAVNLGDLCLSDDLNQPGKWYLPAQVLNPGAFVLIWADGSPAQGPLHSNFKLDAGGEGIGLFTKPALGSHPVDLVLFGKQTEDVTSGLIPNGDGLCSVLTSPTPGYSNVPVNGIAETPATSAILQLYPNPADMQVALVLSDAYPSSVRGETWIVLNDIQGKELRRMKPEPDQALVHLDVQDVAPGLYLVHVYRNGAHAGGRKLIIR